MKKIMVVVLVLCLSMGLMAMAAAETSTLSYMSFELPLPAAALKVLVPFDMDSYEGDEEAYDYGFRFNCYTDTFDLTVYVHESREDSLEAYAAFYAQRHTMDAQADRVNGFAVQRLTSADRPFDVTYLVTAPDQVSPSVVYDLAFACDGEADAALAQEIIGTLALYE